MAQDDKPAREPGERKRQALIAAGVATGIGSAALVAALLYAGRTREKAKGDTPPTRLPDATD